MTITTFSLKDHTLQKAGDSNSVPPLTVNSDLHIPPLPGHPCRASCRWVFIAFMQRNGNLGLYSLLWHYKWQQNCTWSRDRISTFLPATWMPNFPLASLLVQQSLHFGPTAGNLPHRSACNLWHSCAWTSPEMPDLCHFIIRRALNVTSRVLITPSGNSCHLGTALKCYTELSSALCKVF